MKLYLICILILPMLIALMGCSPSVTYHGGESDTVSRVPFRLELNASMIACMLLLAAAVVMLVIVILLIASSVCL